MPTARKLPSGSWRCQVFSHYEPAFDKSGRPILDENGRQKKKRIYESFTCDDPGKSGKKKCERMAAIWADGRENTSSINKMTVGEAIDKYIESRSSVLSPGTVREYKRSRKCDMQELMSIQLRSIHQEDIQRCINRESLNHSPKSVRNMHGLLSAVLKAYRPDFNLTTALPKKVRPKLYIPSDAEIQRLIEYVKDTDMEVPVVLAAFGPMRRGEIAALDSEHITGNIIHVEYSMALDEHNEWVRKAPKSLSGDRYIEFPDFVISKLSGIHGKITHLKPNQISDRFIDVVNRAGLPHFTFHGLRHYSASIQHALGIPDSYIMQRGGWGSDSVLKNVYRHVLEDKASKMNDIANEYFKNICNTKCNTNKENP